MEREHWRGGITARLMAFMFGTPRPTEQLEPTAVTTVAGETAIERPRYYQQYRDRRRSLPVNFSTREWEIAQTYWAHRCAICDRPRGLWHTLSQDHWIPLTDPHCPGTIPTNILPLCYGTDGCNNSKGKKTPEFWLIEKLGKRKARLKLEEIHTYFGWIGEQTGYLYAPGTTPCPDCGYPLAYVERADRWHCDHCRTDWQEGDPSS